MVEKKVTRWSRVLDGCKDPALPRHRSPAHRWVDPVELTRQAADRIAHTHLKDVNQGLARQVQDGRLTYTEAVAQGLYRPLGGGDVDIAAIVGALDAHHYDGTTSSSRTPSSPGSRRGRGRSWTSAPVWTRSAGCSPEQCQRPTSKFGP